MTIPWHLYLPIAGNSVNMLLVFAMGGIVGLLSGIFGVGGGFLMTPLLIMIGIPPTVAAASDSNQIVGASTSGTIAHFPDYARTFHNMLKNNNLNINIFLKT